MDDREKEIARIKARMRELGYNERSLSMAATGKPDRVRNLFKGKSRNWRADTYKNIMKILWPENNVSIESNKEFDENGSTYIIKALVRVLLHTNRIKKDDLELAINHQLRELRVHKKSNATEEIDRFLDFLHSEFSQLAYQASSQSPQLPQDQSKKEKTVKN